MNGKSENQSVASGFLPSEWVIASYLVSFITAIAWIADYHGHLDLPAAIRATETAFLSLIDEFWKMGGKTWYVFAPCFLCVYWHWSAVRRNLEPPRWLDSLVFKINEYSMFQGLGLCGTVLGLMEIGKIAALGDSDTGSLLSSMLLAFGSTLIGTILSMLSKLMVREASVEKIA